MPDPVLWQSISHPLLAHTKNTANSRKFDWNSDTNGIVIQTDALVLLSKKKFCSIGYALVSSLLLSQNAWDRHLKKRKDLFGSWFLFMATCIFVLGVWTGWESCCMYRSTTVVYLMVQGNGERKKGKRKEEEREDKDENGVRRGDDGEKRRSSRRWRKGSRKKNRRWRTWRRMKGRRGEAERERQHEGRSGQFVLSQDIAPGNSFLQVEITCRVSVTSQHHHQSMTLSIDSPNDKVRTCRFNHFPLPQPHSHRTLMLRGLALQ